MPVSAFAAYYPDRLIPMGNVVGISLDTVGVTVAGLREIETSNGNISPARDAGIKEGDVIIAVNETSVETIEALLSALSDAEGDVTLTILRNGAERKITLSPDRTNGENSIGIMVRDDLNGIGTVTFYDSETGIYGALGHSVSNTDGNIIKFKKGTLSNAAVESVTKGTSGTPGQLGGVFDGSDTIGNVTVNSDSGIFGMLKSAESKTPVEIAMKSEIEEGRATILSTVDGQEPSEYEIEIVKVFPENGDKRDMMIKVTDKKLLEITGGIVQGMSGSPIIQNGKLIGAVTHVLISDPKKGYGISIEKMLGAAGYEKEAA